VWFVLLVLNGIRLTIVLVAVLTALRASEIFGLRWEAVDFLNQRIWIRRTWIKGREGKGKSAATRTHVPLSGKLASYLMEWKRQSAYTKPTDFVLSVTEAEREEASQWFTVL
jgi:integrase